LTLFACKYVKTKLTFSLDFDRYTSGSPPTNATRKGSAQTQSKIEITTPLYTPGGGQKRFNPFLKDQPPPMVSAEKQPTSPKKPLTPTKEHPLKDLEEEKQRTSDESDFSDTDTKTSIIQVVTADDNEDSVKSDENKNLLNLQQQQQSESTNHETTTTIVDNHNDSDVDLSSGYNNDIDDTTGGQLADNEYYPSEGEGVVQQQLLPGQVVRRKKTTAAKTPSNNNKMRASFPLTKSVNDIKVISQKLEAQMCHLGSETDSSERLEGIHLKILKINA
jgi:hypothetical protein